MTALTSYVAAWVSNDADRIAETVGAACRITECYGPIYTGRDRVRQWAALWFAQGGVVHRWDIKDLIITGDREVAQWTFECTSSGERTALDGASIARVQDGLIVDLREYQTTAPPYDWQGNWR